MHFFLTFLRRLKYSLQFKPSFSLLLDLFTFRSKERISSLRNISLHLRSNSPDIHVAYSSFVMNEYSNLPISKPSIIIDVGAHIGTTAISLSNIYPSAKIISLEPDPYNFQLLQLNTASIPNILPINSALSAHDGYIQLHARHTGSWGNTIVSQPSTDLSKSLRIHSISIPTLMKRYNITHIDLLKIDVEGGEVEILNSSGPWIDSVESILVELHDYILPGCTETFNEATKNFKFHLEHGEKMMAIRSK